MCLTALVLALHHHRLAKVDLARGDGSVDLVFADNSFAPHGKVQPFGALQLQGPVDIIPTAAVS